MTDILGVLIEKAPELFPRNRIASGIVQLADKGKDLAKDNAHMFSPLTLAAIMP
jgi:hypothetical protein